MRFGFAEGHRAFGLRRPEDFLVLNDQQLTSAGIDALRNQRVLLQASRAGRDEAKVRQKLIETGAFDVMIDIRGNFF